MTLKDFVYDSGAIWSLELGSQPISLLPLMGAGNLDQRGAPTH